MDIRNYGFSHCALTYNGVALDSYLDNYMTLNVEGRQLFSPTLNQIQVPGRDGDIVLGKNYPSRDIKVQFLMTAKNNSEWLKQIKTLTHLLQSDRDVEFFFDDEIGVRFGQLSGFEDPPYDSNQGIGWFTIHCPTPFLYSDTQYSTGQIPDLEFDKYDVLIESINVQVKNPTSKVVVSNGYKGTKIILDGQFKAGDQITIDNQIITLNGQNAMKYLDYVESDYHNFKIYSGDYISAGLNNTVLIAYRERSL